MPSLIFTGLTALQLIPRTLNRKFAAAAKPQECVRSLFMTPDTCATLLVDLDVHPRVIM
jgi:hypothetical protein